MVVALPLIKDNFSVESYAVKEIPGNKLFDDTYLKAWPEAGRTHKGLTRSDNKVLRRNKISFCLLLEKVTL